MPQARLYKVWNIPGIGTAENDYLNLASDILVSDKASRLYKRLVYDEQIATDVGAFLDQREIGSLFIVQVTAKPAGDLKAIEKAVNEEMQKLFAVPPAQDELDRVRTGVFAQFVRGAERIGGFGGKSDILARSQVFEGSPDAYKRSLDRIAAASPADIQSRHAAGSQMARTHSKYIPFQITWPLKPALIAKQCQRPAQVPNQSFRQCNAVSCPTGWK